MKFCKNCGNAIDDNAIFCSKCGSRTNGDGPRVNFDTFGGFGGYNQYPVYDTTGSAALAVVSFLFWQVGLIVWLFCRHTRPGKARSAAKGALGNACFGMPVLGLVLWILWKGDYQKKDYAKVCGISAIVGAALYALLIVGMVILTLTGAVDEGYYSSFPFGEMSAMINFLR